MGSIPMQAGLASVADLCPCFHRAPRSAQPPERAWQTSDPSCGRAARTLGDGPQHREAVPLEARRAVPGRAPRDSVGQPPRRAGLARAPGSSSLALLCPERATRAALARRVQAGAPGATAPAIPRSTSVPPGLRPASRPSCRHQARKPPDHLSGDRRGLGMADRPPSPQHLLRSRSTCQARRQRQARLSTSDPDTRRRTEKSTGQLVTDVTGEANQQSTMSRWHSDRQGGGAKGGRAGPWAGVRWQESAAGGGRETGILDATMRLCCPTWEAGVLRL